MEEEAEAPVIIPTEVLSNILSDPQNSMLRGKVAKIIQPGKYEYLMKACALMSSGELTFTGVIEISRIMLALRFINSEISSDELWFLANTSGCGSVEEEEGKDGAEEKLKIKLVSF
jgi:hypothetical protein